MASFCSENPALTAPTPKIIEDQTD